jgi:hypothetical protein
MSHYAKVVNGTVTQVIAADAAFFNTFVDTSPGTWIKTSYNTRGGKHYNPITGIEDTSTTNPALRGNYAGIGYIYDQSNDVFHPARPLDRNGILCASWNISAPTWTWIPPVAYPTSTTTPPHVYAWDEPTKTWVLV